MKNSDLSGHNLSEKPSSDIFTQIREATVKDVSFLEQLEKKCFSENRQSSCKSIKNSIFSPSQLVFIAEIFQDTRDQIPAGSATVFLYRHSIRIYSIAVDKEFRSLGVGKALINSITRYAKSCNYEKIVLEVDAGNVDLINWYLNQNFHIEKLLDNYYGNGENAYKMVKAIVHSGTIAPPFVIVSDVLNNSIPELSELKKIYSPEEYITENMFAKSKNCRVLNLCGSYKTHSMGYYVSLLAAARNHRVTPSVMALKDLSNLSIAQSILDDFPELFSDKIKKYSNNFNFELVVIIGHTESKKYLPLAKKLYKFFEVPFLSIEFYCEQSLKIKKIKILSPKYTLDNHMDILKSALCEQSEMKQQQRTKLKTYKYDLAILVNKNEKTPPSCPLALEKFRKAGEKIGFFVEYISKTDFRRICEFDALFIRETTAVDNHTYAMARNGYTEGLVVIDDPWSILLCSNKIFLHERFINSAVSQPRSWLFTKSTIKKVDFLSLPFPLVLKLPESSFSQGVFCVYNMEDLGNRLTEMFSVTSMVIAQEFMKTDYDWRIGILDNTPLFACKYYMADEHWQIYNWNSENSTEFSGKSETFSINQVPAHILKTALKAASLIGNGLYGVDLKDINGTAYVIEVNDNPSIDAGVEDSILGDELYIRIMTSIHNRIEAERQQTRYLI
jgi:glutathione synthase/RimK-type ligase-like ATP-grasp enzyme/ribosomal protein S18 acetylase RimI-like enzyme